MKIWQRAHDRNISFAFFTLFRSIYLFKIASTRFRFSRESLPRKHATVTIVEIPFLLFRLPFVHPLVTCTFPRTRCSIDQRSPWSFAYEPISSWISVEFMPNPRTTVQLLIRNTNYRYFSTTKPENQSVNQLVSFEHIYFNRPFDFLHKNVLSSIQLSQE